MENMEQELNNNVSSACIVFRAPPRARFNALTVN